jgi:hypothetical protein
MTSTSALRGAVVPRRFAASTPASPNIVEAAACMQTHKRVRRVDVSGSTHGHTHTHLGWLAARRKVFNSNISRYRRSAIIDVCFHQRGESDWNLLEDAHHFRSLIKSNRYQLLPKHIQSRVSCDNYKKYMGSRGGVITRPILVSVKTWHTHSTSISNNILITPIGTHRMCKWHACGVQMAHNQRGRGWVVC